jgi:thiol-disulfide isomerase/thioredoxin
LDGATAWFNSAQLNPKSLRGKVVLVNFWTYSCINSLRALPYVKYWAAKYQSSGLIVIGVHTPEFSFEKVECPATFVPELMRQTGMRGALNGAREEAYA